VRLTHGQAKFVRDLARVDVTIHVSNVGAADIEWTRVLAVDPAAEVIGAGLTRAGEELAARTLATGDAQRIYGEIRGWQPYRRDPLRVERERRDQVAVAVWPLAPGETVRVRLTFVTPLRGHGTARTYVHPILEDAAPSPEPATTTPGTGPLVDVRSQFVVDPGSLVFDGAAGGTAPAGAVAGRLRFVTAGAAADGGRTSVRFRAPEAEAGALAVPGGGLGTRVVTWRFDPEAFLASHGISEREGVRLVLRALPGEAGRIAPDRFDGADEAFPVAARVRPDVGSVRYAVEATGPFGRVEDVEEVAVSAESRDRELVGAVAGWHRAQMASKAIAAAGADPARLARAVAYAVDLGVLVPGSAALAIPKAEQRLLPTESRHQYASDGVPLGAPKGEADLKSPPSGLSR
jgi:hypothetical protein